MSHDASSRPVDAVAERFVDDHAALDPIAATYVGLPGYDDRLTDLSPDGFAARAQLTRQALADASAATPTDEREQVAKDAFLERLGLDVELDEAGVPQSQISVINSGLHQVRSVFDLMPTEGEQAWSNIDARLAAIPAALDGYRETVVRAADSGDVAAKRQLLAVAEQVRSWTGQDGGANFFLDLVAGSDVEGLRGDLERHATEASDAFAAFGRWLSDDFAARGRDKDAVGRERYSLGSRYFLGATVDLDETYAWGFEELKRIEDEMARVADKIAPRRVPRRCRVRPRGRPLPPHRGQGGVPRLDAGSGHPHPRGHARDPLRHPRADPPDRVLHRAHHRRRHLLHRTERGLHPARPHVVGRPGGRGRASPPGARSPRSTTRACRGTTSRSPRPPTARRCSTAGSG